VIYKTPAKCEVKIRVGVRLLHCNGVVRNDFFISAISAVLKGIEVWLLELLIITIGILLPSTNKLLLHPELQLIPKLAHQVDPIIMNIKIKKPQ
jgi:hypothetical protein